MTASPPAMLRFGSLHGRLVSARQQYTDALDQVFGVELRPLSPDQQDPPYFELIVAESAAPPGGGLPAIPPDSMELGGTRERPTITTEVLRAELRLDRQPVHIRLTVLQQDMPYHDLCVHFSVVIHKIFFQLERVILHAGAVQVDGEVCIFVGDKGAGKSTTCLALARAGGTVLGEDQVIVRRSAAGYLVSGGDERSRVTERTERHFFPEPLAVQPQDFAGTMKKEIRMGDFFRSEPFQDFAAHQLLFPRVTGRFQLRRLKAQPALLRLMAYSGRHQRFHGASDQANFLDFLAGFIATVSCWELTLSDDLTELDLLAEKLRSA